MNVAVDLLGPLEAYDTVGRRIAFPTRKAEALLAVLALSTHGRASRDRILGLLWGDRPEADARHSLSQTLTSLRRALGQRAISADRNAVGLVLERIDIDVLSFLRAIASDDLTDLRRAAALYRGTLLDGMVLREAAFQQWSEAERRRLTAIAVDAITRLGRTLARSGDDLGAVRAFERALLIDPLAGATHAALMRCHLEHGRTARVARHYAHCVDLYRRELDAEAGAEIEGIARAAADAGVEARRAEAAHAQQVLRPESARLNLVPTALHGDSAQALWRKVSIGSGSGPRIGLQKGPP